MMRSLICVTVVCGFLLSATCVSATTSQAPADVSLPQGHQFTTTRDAVQVGPTLQLTPVGSAPAVCAGDLRGVMALTHALRLCICDGRLWMFEGTDKTCDWTATPIAKAASP